MRRRAFLPFAFVLTAAAGLARAGDAAESFASGAWSGEARFSNGYFTHCVMVRGYPGGATLRFSINRGGQLAIGVDDPAWDVSRRREDILRLQIDATAPIVANAVIVEHEVSAVFEPDPDIVRRFRSGKTLRITYGRLAGTYELGGTNEALTRLARCAAMFD